MDKRPLHELLQALHTQLQQTPPPTEAADRELLEAVSQDIQALLAGSSAGERPARDESLRARLDEAVRRFEQTHPTLTLALGQLIDTLSRAGV